MSEHHEISFDLEVNVEPAYQELRRVQTLLMDTLLLMRRLNLPPDLNRAISLMMRARLTAERLIRSIELLQAATIAGGPIMWLTALVSFGISTFAASDLLMDLGG